MNTPARLCSMLAVCAVMSPAFTAEPARVERGDMLRREPVTLKFRYDSRELETPQGAQRVYRRLARTARRQCTLSGSLLTELRVDERCIAELVADGVNRTASVLLAGVHRGTLQAEIAARR